MEEVYPAQTATDFSLRETAGAAHHLTKTWSKEVQLQETVRKGHQSLTAITVMVRHVIGHGLHALLAHVTLEAVRNHVAIGRVTKPTRELQNVHCADVEILRG